MILQLPPSVHRHDPSTSHHAAREHTESGKREANIALVLRCVQNEPGLTAWEIGERSYLGQTEAARRLSDLKDMHRVFREGTRIVEVEGVARKAASRWFPVLSQGALL